MHESVCMHGDVCAHMCAHTHTHMCVHAHVHRYMHILIPMVHNRFIGPLVAYVH